MDKPRCKWNARKGWWHRGVFLLRACQTCRQLMLAGSRARHCVDCRAKSRPVINKRPRIIYPGHCVVCGVSQNRGTLCYRCYLARGKKQSRAQRATRKAVFEGKLPVPSTLQCADCKAPAHVYDHLSYDDPLAVEPVCRSCNVRRGPPEGRRPWVSLIVSQTT